MSGVRRRIIGQSHLLRRRPARTEAASRLDGRRLTRGIVTHASVPRRVGPAGAGGRRLRAGGGWGDGGGGLICGGDGRQMPAVVSASGREPASRPGTAHPHHDQEESVGNPHPTCCTGRMPETQLGRDRLLRSELRAVTWTRQQIVPRIPGTVAGWRECRTRTTGRALSRSVDDAARGA